MLSKVAKNDDFLTNRAASPKNRNEIYQGGEYAHTLLDWIQLHA